MFTARKQYIINVIIMSYFILQEEIFDLHSNHRVKIKPVEII